MPRDIDGFSYECDCGHQSHFCGSTLSEVKTKSHRRPVYLGDAAFPNEHTIVFRNGKMVDIICPKIKAKLSDQASDPNVQE